MASWPATITDLSHASLLRYHGARWRALLRTCPIRLEAPSFAKTWHNYDQTFGASCKRERNTNRHLYKCRHDVRSGAVFCGTRVNLGQPSTGANPRYHFCVTRLPVRQLFITLECTERAATSYEPASMIKPKARIWLSPADRTRVEGCVRGRRTPQKLILPAGIALPLADRMAVTVIAPAVDKSKLTVSRCHERYLANGIDGPQHGATRPDRKPPLFAKTIQQVVRRPLHADRGRRILRMAVASGLRCTSA